MRTMGSSVTTATASDAPQLAVLRPEVQIALPTLVAFGDVVGVEEPLRNLLLLDRLIGHQPGQRVDRRPSHPRLHRGDICRLLTSGDPGQAVRIALEPDQLDVGPAGLRDALRGEQRRTVEGGDDIA